MPRIGYQKRKFKQIEMLADGKLVWLTASAAAKSLLEMRVAGDTYPRLKIKADGTIEWGPGNAALDILLSRGGANLLKTFDQLYLYHGGSRADLVGTGTEAHRVQVDGDTVFRLVIYGNGDIKWGPGNAAVDCVLARRAANILNTPDRIEVGSLGVGNSAGGDVTATSADYKVQVFDAAGNSLGYLQVFAG